MRSGEGEGKCMQPYPRKRRGYFQDLNPWPWGHKAATLPLYQNSPSNYKNFRLKNKKREGGACTSERAVA